jgi:hypothetical protein
MLLDDPKVQNLLLALWNAPQRDWGLPVVDLLQDFPDAVLVACFPDLIYFAKPRYWDLLDRSGTSFGGWVEIRKTFNGQSVKGFLHDLSCKEPDLQEKERTRAKLTEKGEPLAAEIALKRDRGTSTTETTSNLLRPPKGRNGRGGATLKLIAMLCHHHRIATEKFCSDPIGVRELAELAKVSVAVTSTFFKVIFGNHDAYKALCSEPSEIEKKLNELNNPPKDRLRRR